MWRKEKLAKASKYVLYYGYGREQDLSRFDVAIVEPGGHSPESIKRIQEVQTLVLAYLSVLEIAPYASEYRLLKKEDFLKGNTGRLVNEEFDTYLLDLRSKKWSSLLCQKAYSLLHSGYDGLFLDTIGNIESPLVLPEDRDALIMAAVNWLKSLRKNYPDHILIQNNGLERLCLYTARLIDGICWENPPLARKESALWLEGITSRLQQLQTEHALKIFILSEESIGNAAAMAGRFAKERGFLFYKAKSGYTEGIILE